MSLNNFAIRAVTLAAGQFWPGDEMHSLFEPIKRRESLDNIDRGSGNGAVLANNHRKLYMKGC